MINPQASAFIACTPLLIDPLTGFPPNAANSRNCPAAGKYRSRRRKTLVGLFGNLSHADFLDEAVLDPRDGLGDLPRGAGDEQ